MTDDRVAIRHYENLDDKIKKLMQRVDDIFIKNKPTVEHRVAVRHLENMKKKKEELWDRVHALQGLVPFVETLPVAISPKSNEPRIVHVFLGFRYRENAAYFLKTFMSWIHVDEEFKKMEEDKIVFKTEWENETPSARIFFTNVENVRTLRPSDPAQFSLNTSNLFTEFRRMIRDQQSIPLWVVAVHEDWIEIDAKNDFQEETRKYENLSLDRVIIISVGGNYKENAWREEMVNEVKPKIHHLLTSIHEELNKK